MIDKETHSSTPMAALDALLFKGDTDPRTRPVMSAVLLLDRTPGWDLLETVFEQATRQVPRMRQRAVVPPLPVIGAEWVLDHDFDLRYHLRRIGVGASGSLTDVLGIAATAATAPFDPARPLWEATLVEGLSDGRAALLLRAHHSMADGMAVLAMLFPLFDMERDPDGRAAPLPVEARTPPRSPLAPRLLTAPFDLAALAVRGSASMTTTAASIAADPRRAISDAVGYAQSLARLARPPAAAPSAALSRRSRARHFATLEVPLDDLRGAAKAVGCSLNDAFLAGLLGGFRRYHQHLGLAVHDVPLALPINVRSSTDRTDGNRFAAARIAGPATIDDAAQRMRSIRPLVIAARAEPALDAATALAPLLRHLPARLAAIGMGGHAQQIDLQASNLIGAPVPIYLAGARVVRMYPFGPLAGVPVMAVLLSHDGTCCIGITLDPAAVEHPDVIPRVPAGGVRAGGRRARRRPLETRGAAADRARLALPSVGTTRVHGRAAVTASRPRAR